MTVLRSLDETYDNVFSTLTETMLNEQVTLDDAKALLLSHKCKLKRRKVIQFSPLSTANMNQVTSVQKYLIWTLN